MAGSMSHPNIVTVHDYFEQDGIPYIAMEYVPKGSLRAYCGHLDFAQIVGVLEGVLAGLAHAETKGIVTSMDGITWTQSASATTALGSSYAELMGYNGTYFICLTDGLTTLLSMDGATWKSNPASSPSGMLAVTSGQPLLSPRRLP